VKRDYPRLRIEDFGEHLLKSNDLDPIYNALVGTRWNRERLARWCLAYWTFYHAGVASWICDGGTSLSYWRRFNEAACNVEPAPTGGRFPRGHERRHMRGERAVKTAQHLQAVCPEPELWAIDIIEAIRSKPQCKAVMDLVKLTPNFGPWIGFKVADMLERVFEEPVSFERAEVFMFKDPKKAALMLWRIRSGLPETAKPRDEAEVIRQVVDHLQKHFWEVPAPPHRDRPVGLQEIETILCKWKSHMNGHYPLNNDITDITDGIQPWLEHSSSAREFASSLPKNETEKTSG
jgi:hypothetical protein